MAMTIDGIKPYYEADGIIVIHGDCLDILPKLPLTDQIMTSPPYNLGGSPWPHLGHWKPGDSIGGKSKWRNGSDGSGGVQYEGFDDAMPHASYVTWQHTVLKACWDRLSPRGVICYNHKPRVIGGQCWLPLELNPDLPLRQIVIWARSGGMNFNPTAFVPTHEWLMLFAKPLWRLKSKAISGFGDVWQIPQEAKTPHPAPFPLELPLRMIHATTAPMIYDPFMGWGTTLLAAKELGRRAIGIDINERYCELAANRLRQGVLPLGAAPSSTAQSPRAHAAAGDGDSLELW